MGDESDAEQIQQHVNTGNFHAAINISISGLSEYRRNDDQAGVDGYLRVINGITKKMADKFGSEDVFKE